MNEGDAYDHFDRHRMASLDNFYNCSAFEINNNINCTIFITANGCLPVDNIELQIEKCVF